MLERLGKEGQRPKQAEQQQSLKPCLVKLAGMAAQLVTRMGENNASRQIRRAAPEFTIDVISEAAK